MLFKCEEAKIAVEGSDEVVQRMAQFLKGIFEAAGTKYEMTVEA